MSETVRAIIGTSLRWLWLQIESFPIPIEEIVHIQAFAGANMAWRLSRRPVLHGTFRPF
jgi:hypothetical protein